MDFGRERELAEPWGFAMVPPRMSGEALNHQASAVASHYDDLDAIYRRIWGESLHHGLWDRGTKTTSEAADRMTDFLGRCLDLRPGERLWDVGCGRGRMAMDLAEKYSVKAGGLTISRKQWEQAVSGVDVQWGDWLENRLPDGAFDAVMAVESLEHMSDSARAVAEMARVVKPGGRIVLACWMTCDRPSEWERKLLIDPIRRDGLLDGMANEQQVRQWVAVAGLDVLGADDLSRRVEKTWSDCLLRAIRLSLGDWELRRLVFLDPGRSVSLALTLARVWISYVLGTLRYVVFTLRRPV